MIIITLQKFFSDFAFSSNNEILNSYKIENIMKLSYFINTFFEFKNVAINNFIFSFKKK
jgi:hypothetical protein